MADATWLALNVVSGGGGFSSSQPIGVTKIAKSVIAPLADQNISVFMLSTYQTDFILVRGPEGTRQSYCHQMKVQLGNSGNKLSGKWQKYQSAFPRALSLVVRPSDRSSFCYGMKYLLSWVVWCLMRVLSPHYSLSCNEDTGSTSHHHSDIGFLKVREKVSAVRLAGDGQEAPCFGYRQTDYLSVSYTRVCACAQGTALFPEETRLKNRQC